MKVLVIDDEFEIRESIKSMFIGTDVESFFVSDAISALICLKDNRDIKIIVTDYRLPGFGGKDWIDLLKYYHPKINIVVISGYNLAIDKLGSENFVTLKKPFTRQQLLEAVGR